MFVFTFVVILNILIISMIPINNNLMINIKISAIDTIQYVYYYSQLLIILYSHRRTDITTNNTTIITTITINTTTTSIQIARNQLINLNSPIHLYILTNTVQYYTSRIIYTLLYRIVHA